MAELVGWDLIIWWSWVGWDRVGWGGAGGGMLYDRQGVIWYRCSAGQDKAEQGRVWFGWIGAPGLWVGGGNAWGSTDGP